MLEKLHGVEEKYLDLEAKLSDPDVVSDPKEYQKYAKAHAKLQEIVNVYREYKEQKALYDDDMAVAEENSDPELAEMAREEAESLKPVLEDYEKKLTLLLLPGDPNDDKDIILEIRAGAGGEEAALFAEVLFRMYTRYADTMGWSVELMDANPTELGGFKEVVAQISDLHGGGAAGGGRGGRGYPHGRYPDRYLPGRGRRRAVCQQDGIRSAHDPYPHRHRGPVPG